MLQTVPFYSYLDTLKLLTSQAAMPVTVFSVGIMLGTEEYEFKLAANLVVIAIGVGIASYGESLQHVGHPHTDTAIYVYILTHPHSIGFVPSDHVGWPCF